MHLKLESNHTQWEWGRGAKWSGLNRPWDLKSILKSDDNLKKTQTLWDNLNEFVIKNQSFSSGLTFVKWLKLALSNINCTKLMRKQVKANTSMINSDQTKSWCTIGIKICNGWDLESRWENKLPHGT